MKDDLHFQDYLVVFFDLLGQRESLRKIKGIPITGPKEQEFIGLIKGSIGKVLMIRDYFEEFFTAATTYITNVELVAPEHREQFVISQKADFHFYGLSDAIVIAVPLMGEYENCTAVNGVYSAFTATCGIGLFALSKGIPVRAGLDVGVGTQIDDREIYGPVLERAVHLEGQLAEYPRFIVGEELTSYLRWVVEQEYKTPFGKIAKSVAELCGKMIIQDTDGRFMLDFLGKTVKETFGISMGKDVVITAKKFVESEMKKYINSGNDKLASRYFRLLSYFHSRQTIWDIN